MIRKSTYDENVILVVDSNMKRIDKKKCTYKITQIVHVSQKKLLDLLKTAGMVDQESKYLLKNIYKFVTNIHILK